MGQIRKRGKVYWIRYYRNGKRHEESAHTSNHEVARGLLKQREGDISKGVPITPAIGRLTFDDAAKDLENEYTMNGRKSIEGLRDRIAIGLRPFFAGRRMASITTTDIRSFVTERQAAKAANATINLELSALKRMFTLARQASKLLVAPHIPMLQLDNVRRGFFEREMFDSLRAHLPAEVQPVVTFAYLTGWRASSEVLTLQWHQVDLDAAIVRLDPGTTKNREGRTFPFSMLPELQAVLEEQRAITTALERSGGKIVPWVFHRAGVPIAGFRKSWITACKAAGCPGRIPHDFRRTAVRNLVRAGVPERVAMTLTGHKTRSVFERYNIVSEADLGAGVEKLARLAGTISGTIASRPRAVNEDDQRFAAGILVAREGIEPPTPQFSVVCSTN
jgi:integrase